MIAFPNKKYEVIYADPPWQYGFSKSNNRKIENQYPTMTLKEIKELPVGRICEKNCVLYLWATAPKLIEALSVMDAWGFEYKTNSIWDKELLGMGYWWRGRHELLLVGTNGKFSPPPQQERDSSVYSERRTRHSNKPQWYRDRINIYYPNASKIELFARNEMAGWDCWGNEVNLIENESAV